MRPDSMRERSNMSLIRLSNSSLLVLIKSRNCVRSSFSSSVSLSAELSRLEKPTIAFNGVRISWLILARNADFIWSDSFAFSNAISNILFCLIRSSCAFLLYFSSRIYIFPRDIAMMTTVIKAMARSQFMAVACRS